MAELRNFDSRLDEAGVPRMVIKSTTKSQSKAEYKQHAYKGDTDWQEKDPEQWTWKDLRDYVTAQIETRFGPFPKNPHKEGTIFSGFLSRWGPRGVIIAKFVFENQHLNGWWIGAPVSITRFSQSSDPYFAEVISKRLGQEPIYE